MFHRIWYSSQARTKVIDRSVLSMMFQVCPCPYLTRYILTGKSPRHPLSSMYRHLYFRQHLVRLVYIAASSVALCRLPSTRYFVFPILTRRFYLLFPDIQIVNTCVHNLSWYTPHTFCFRPQCQALVFENGR